ncbi:c-type cytochrome [Pedobacter cryoconitis]|uniref:Mono/diheme cytochrome c family protein n=1 Tax=Pedobacter cryoconitis TaxID=188932 RepID=A0A7X0J9Y7_9SPHI|nr:cytochrome c [Pedobacter cryoconitis]MBB6502677.1 mono/diheme cytochrome c family protein [Pedobacter cryoconitis]
MNKNKIVAASFVVFSIVATLSSCRDKNNPGLEYARNMYDHIAYDPDQPNKNFANGQTAQTPPANTDPIGFVKYEYANTKEGYEAAGTNLHNPLAKTPQNLLSGKHYFTVFCSPCHGDKGDGKGHLVQIEKFTGVPAYHGDAASSRGGLMKDLTEGKIYHTIMYGLNNMGSHASQLTPDQRWKVVMYVQQLQKIQ